MKHCTLLQLFLLASLTLYPFSKSTATDASWTNAAGGLFSDSANWDPDVPSTTGLATFDLDATYTVNFNASAQTDGVELEDGDVTFNIGVGNTYQTGTIMIADDSDDTAILRVTSGAVNSGGNDVTVADSGTGTLVVQGGATMTTGDFFSGLSPSGLGTITITGASTQLSTARVNMRRGTTNLTISNGATLQTNGDMDIVQQRGNATVTVDNATLTVGGGSMLTVGREQLGESDAELFVINGGTVTTRHFSVARQHAGNEGAVGLVEITGEDSTVSVERRVTFGSRPDAGDDGTISNIATVRITEGGQLFTSSSGSTQRETFIGSGATGQGGRGIGIVEIEDEDSVWWVGNATQTTNAIFGHDGGQGSLTVSNGGRIELVAGDQGGFSFLEDSQLNIASGRVVGRDLDFSSNAHFHLTLSDSDTTPLISLTGEFDPGNALFELTLAPGFSQFNQPFVIATYDTWSGVEFGSLLLPPDTILEYEANQFVVTIIPEPGAGLLVFLGSALLVMIRRRR